MSKMKLFFVFWVVLMIDVCLVYFKVDIGMSLTYLSEVTWGEMYLGLMLITLFGVWFNDKVRCADREEFWESISDELQKKLEEKEKKG